MKTLITAANGMFGNATLHALVARGASVRAFVRDAKKFRTAEASVELYPGNLDDPASIAGAVEGVDQVFLVTPMDDCIAHRETAVIAAAKAAGVRHVVKIYGAVNHAGDPLDAMHLASIEALKTSGMEWTLVSPNSVMETSLLGMAPWIAATGEWYGISGQGRIGMVALADVAEVAALVLTSEGHHAKNYELTGPVAFDLYEAAATLSEVLGRKIPYVDLPDDTFAKMLIEDGGFSPEAAELQVLCHLRLWRQGAAEKVTRTYLELTSKEPTSLRSFLEQHAAAFS